MRIAAMHSGGKTIQLQAGHYQAKIVTVGAGLAELTHRGRHLLFHTNLKRCRWRIWENIGSLAKSRSKRLLSA
jgi:galactose mutarotase-like enzyme